MAVGPDRELAFAFRHCGDARRRFLNRSPGTLSAAKRGEPGFHATSEICPACGLTDATLCPWDNCPVKGQ